MTTTIEELLSTFSASTFSLEIPEAFISRFFRQRQLITSTTKAFYKKNLRSEHSNIDLSLVWDGTDIWGQSTIEENFALYQIVQVLKPRSVLEIGLFRGQTAVNLNQALTDVGGGNYIGMDISQDTLDIVSEVLKKANMDQRAQLNFGDSAEKIQQIPSVDLAFIDGNHDWSGVVSDVVNVYNKQVKGGVIAIHDVGTPAWGWCVQDPGRLLHEALPERLAGHASIYWLDSMCRQTTMKLLSPRAGGTNSYFTSVAESLEKARVTTHDTVKGWGGIGFILKQNGTHQLDLEELLNSRPKPFDLNPPSNTHTLSIIGRIVRRLASKVP